MTFGKNYMTHYLVGIRQWFPNWGHITPRR